MDCVEIRINTGFFSKFSAIFYVTYAYLINPTSAIHLTYSLFSSQAYRIPVY